MYRIHSLRLQYFKGFQQRTFVLEGKNVLLYGTNGSGKSSLYWALYTLLQASIKPDGPADAQRRYFGPYVPNDELTHQSLRNAYAPVLEGDEQQIRQRETGLEIECRDTANPGAPIRQYHLSQTQAIGYNSIDLSLLQQATLASDFVYYRQLQEFSLSSNKRAVNLWPVFLRDLFPYDSKPGAAGSADDTFENRLRKLIAEFPRDASGKVFGRNRTEYKNWESRARQFNTDISQYISNLQIQANTLLETAFGDGESQLKIEFLWNPPASGSDEPFRAHQLSGEVMRKLTYDTRLSVAQNVEEQLATLRSDQPNNLLISFRVSMLDQTGNVLASSDRPQTFLNEARLTRVALAVRLGALLVRLQAADLKLLCLDDLLVSLDSSNRWLVLKWLFNPATDLGTRFQILFFTHDRELYSLVSHQIEKGGLTEQWCFYNLFAPEKHDEESTLFSGENNYVERAKRQLEALDFPAAANYMRKECERLIKRFLPPTELRAKGKDGAIEEPMLDGLITKLESHFKKYGETFSPPLTELKLYKDLHLNPLSHDNPGTAIYQNELKSILYNLIPALAALKQTIIIPLVEFDKTLAEILQPDSTGAVTDLYRIELFEPLRAFVFPNRTRYSNPRCRWIGTSKPDGRFIRSEDKDLTSEELQKVYKRICGKLRLTEQADVVSIMRPID